MAEWLTWLLGGRPMRRVEYRFTDVVSGLPVYLWCDAFGRLWLAEHSWAWFRVRARSEGGNKP